VPGSDYEHTLSTVWQGSFGKLTENSTRLLNVLSFLNPDCLPEDILSQGAEGLGEEFSFLSDGMELLWNTKQSGFLAVRQKSDGIAYSR